MNFSDNNPIGTKVIIRLPEMIQWEGQGRDATWCCFYKAIYTLLSKRI